MDLKLATGQVRCLNSVWAILVLSVMAGTSCAPGNVARVRFVVDHKINGRVLLVPDPQVRLNLEGVQRLEVDQAEIHVPPILISDSVGLSLDLSVVDIVDRNGAVLAVGMDPSPGTWGFLGIVTEVDPNEPVAAKRSKSYAKFGVKPNLRADTRTSPQRSTLVIPPVDHSTTTQLWVAFSKNAQVILL